MKICKICGSAFTPAHHFHTAYCSSRCREMKPAYKPRQPTEKLCERCGGRFMTFAVTTHRYCSPRCKEGHSALERKNCESCGQGFEGYRMKRFCSEKCQKRDESKRRRSADPLAHLSHDPVDCLVCGKPIPAPRPSNQKYCSKKCSKKQAKRKSDRRQRKKPHNFVRYALSRRLGDLLRRQGLRKDNSVLGVIGCSQQELVVKLESQFSEGMSWQNYGVRGWHIDHLIPCSRFDLSKPEHQRVCFNWRNLRPLWAKTNWHRADEMRQEDVDAVDPVLVEMMEGIGLECKVGLGYQWSRGV